MERVVTEGEVATANTYAQMFSTLPSCGRPTRLMTYDIHTLQNRFYLSGATLASLHTTIPCLLPLLGSAGVDAVAFPDDGAAKRFKHMFDADRYGIIVCGKVRDGDKRVVTVQDGDATGRRVIVIDDLVQTGGTLYECGAKLLELGAASVSAFVAHGVFPRDAWRRFARGGDRDVFSKFYVTNSIPTTTDRCVSAASCFFLRGDGVYHALAQAAEERRLRGHRPDGPPRRRPAARADVTCRFVWQLIKFDSALRRDP